VFDRVFELVSLAGVDAVFDLVCCTLLDLLVCWQLLAWFDSEAYLASHYYR
jgi:hypothetical protein